MSCTSCGSSVTDGGLPPLGGYDPGHSDGYGVMENGSETPGGWLDNILSSNCNICMRCLFFWLGVGTLAFLILFTRRS